MILNFYTQTYTCEDGTFAKIIIPETATQDDLLGFREFIDIILKRRFKLELKDV